MRVPDVVLYDMDCPLIEPRTFAEILRANPRTHEIPMVMIGTEAAADRVRGGLRETFIRKPFNVDEVLGRVEQLFRNAEADDEVRREGGLEGSLAQLSPPDLLQLLALNRRTGTLHMTNESAGETDTTGQVFLREGLVADAALGEVKGEKALYRLIHWTNGTFSFTPGGVEGRRRIQLSMDEVLLEAMRQQDELTVLRARAPERNAVLALTMDPAQVPEGLHPITEEILGLIDAFHNTGDVVDHARATDLEALRAITTLIERGMVRVMGTASTDSGRALVATETAFALHGRPTQRKDRLSTLQVMIAVEHPTDLRGMLSELSAVQGWRPSAHTAAREHGLGELGVVRLDGALEIVLTALPAEDLLAPLWRPFASGAVGVVLLLGDGTHESLLPIVQFFVDRDRLVAIVGDEPPLHAAAGKLGVRATSGVVALARLLERVARRPNRAAS